MDPHSSEREKFATDELAIVLSHFDIGVLEEIKEFPRGSRKAPKLLIRSDRGEYLLKRRARGKDDPFRVAFTHELQLYLAEKQFPLPHLIGTRKDNNSMLEYNGTVYELFEYIRGSAYDNSLDATFDSGRILGLYHKLLRDHSPHYEPPVGSYHNSRAINGSLDQIPFTFSRSDRRRNVSQAEVGSTVAFLRDAYMQAAHRVNEAHLPDWPQQVVHGDWHPGNMLFRNHRVVAVIDYDAARQQQRIIDLANGALQFSIIGGSDDPITWPDYLDEGRFKRFVRGYDSVDVISTGELEVMPWLMVEAMVAESALPIAATGSFGRIDGYPFLQMIERKVRWVLKQHQHLVQSVAQ